MTARQLGIILLLFALGVGIGYWMGTRYYMPRPHYINFVITEAV